MQPSKPLKTLHKPTRLALLLPVLMLTACAHNSPVCLPESPQLPTPPSVMQQPRAVLGECIGEYQAPAGQADQHANDARLMRKGGFETWLDH